jgi:hypothetical protein
MIPVNGYASRGGCLLIHTIDDVGCLLDTVASWNYEYYPVTVSPAQNQPPIPLIIILCRIPPSEPCFSTGSDGYSLSSHFPGSCVKNTTGGTASQAGH